MTRPIVLSAPSFRSSNSFSKMARNHAIQMYLQGIDVYIKERGEYCPVDVTPQWQKSHLNHLCHKSINVPKGAMWVYYDIPDGMKDRSNSINLTTFETSNIHKKWADYASSCIHTLTISNHNRYLLIGEGVSPEQVSVVNLGYDPTLYSPDATPLFKNKDKYTFIFVGHCNPRKGIDTLIHAYCDEFSSSEDVCLKIFTQPMYGNNDVHKYINEIKSKHNDTPEIEVVVNDFNGGFTEDQMPSIYTSGNCLVSPTRGEAFGLPLLEAKACGLDVITTKCSGQLDFLNEENSFLVPVQNIAEVSECNSVSNSYDKLKFWIPDHNILKSYMRHVFNGESRLSKLDAWTWENKIYQFVNIFKKLGVIK